MHRLPLLAFLGIPFSASASITPLYFYQSLVTNVSGDYSFTDTNGTSHVSQVTVAPAIEYYSYTFPLKPQNSQRVLDLPYYAGHTNKQWVGPAPFVSSAITVPVWNTPAASIGSADWGSVDIKFVSNYQRAGNATGTHFFLRIEFATTTPYYFNVSGWKLNHVQSNQTVPPGILLPGHYSLQLQPPLSGGLSASYTGTSILRLSPTPLGTDSDGDGIVDADEGSSYQTDPTKADTDNDGLSDPDEVSIHFTNPGNPDHDGDGFTDGLEISVGKLPRDPISVPDMTLIVRPGIELFTITKLGFPYLVQSSPDLKQWTDLETIQGDGKETHYGSEAADSGVKFWRLIEIQ
ncbi:hypothetical protein [Luteolibacter sp. Populi]|uniref:hypothetical protein n=1 Tax=Luteolibacter sp. Populi TaxID=3230487 RepID=UPI003467628A